MKNDKYHKGILLKSRVLYFFMGLGLGIFIVAGLYLIFPNSQKQVLTKEEIIEKARSYGMVFLSESLIQSIEQEDTFFVSELLSIEELAERLQNEGYIEDFSDFISYVNAAYPDEESVQGNFYVKKDMTFQELCTEFFGKSTK